MGGNPNIIIPHCTFVDDITLIADNVKDAQELLNIVQECMEEMGLRINEKKSSLIVKQRNHTNTTYPTIKINNHIIETLTNDKAFRFLGVHFNTDLNWDKQFELLKKKLIQQTYQLKNQSFTTKQKVSICNLLFTPSIAYRLNVVNLNEGQCKSLDQLLCNVIIESANLHHNHAKAKIWDANNTGGAGLVSLTHLNDIVFTSNVINYGLNAANKFPRVCLEQLALDQGIDLSNITKTKTSQMNPSILTRLIKSLQSTNLQLLKPNNKIEPFPFSPKKYVREDYIWDKLLNKKVLPIFTDGSHNPITNRTTSAMVVGRNMKLTYAWDSTTQGSSYFGELSACERALNNIDNETQTIIFIDCQSVIDINAIENNQRKYSDVYKDPARSYRNRIQSIKELAHCKGIPMPIFIKVYSHIQDKLNDPKSKPSLIKNINANIEYLAKRFGITTLNTIITGNDKADSLASSLASTKRTWGLPIIPTGTPDYNIIQNNRLLEGSVSGILKNLYKEGIHKKRLTYTKREHYNFKEFDIQLSNTHLTDNNPDSNNTFNHTLKIRNQALFLPARCSPNRPSANKEIEGSTANLKKLAYQVNMPTAICELCDTGELCDYFHLFTCPGLESTSQEITNTVLSTIHKATGNPTIQPYFWCTKVKNRLQPASQPSSSPSVNYCKCNLPKHGNYIKCSDCKNNFHPHCLGISISIIFSI